jgi:hypothetical protein
VPNDERENAGGVGLIGRRLTHGAVRVKAAGEGAERTAQFCRGEVRPELGA